MTKRIRCDFRIRLMDGKTATLSMTELPDKTYEVKLVRNNRAREEISTCRLNGFQEAARRFNAIRDVYHAPDPDSRCKQLAEDLRAALAYGRENAGTDDGGTSNLDSPIIYLPGWDPKRVQAAVSAAGLTCYLWETYFKDSYVLSLPGVGQGYNRTNAAIAMRNFLVEKGYDAGVYTRMD